MSERPYPEFKIFPLGTGALTLEFGTTISAAVNDHAIRAARQISSTRFPGFIEAVPAYASVTVFFDVDTIRHAQPFEETCFRAVAEKIAEILEDEFEEAEDDSRLIEICASFGGADGPDLDFVSGRAGLPVNDVIDIFVSETYRVFMLGFLPGFAYLGQVDERIATPRKPTPRLSVPKGSIGIAGVQTGIYPVDSPGGWQLIGRTAVEMFNAHLNPPCLLRPGDRVKFRRV